MSIPPEHLLKACLLMALFSVRSERQFCERLEYDLLFKWFLDLNIMDHSFDHSVFAKNRQRLLDADVAREFLLEIVEQAREQRLLSEEHFSVDGTLLEAWASVKSFRPRDGDPPSGDGGRNSEVDFHGERCSNETHRSTTDPEARLAKKGRGKEARLCFGAHVLMDNREGLAVDVRLTPADGSGEWAAAVEMLASVSGTGRITLGADRGDDTRGFVRECRKLKVTPHVARKQRSAIDGRTTHHEGYRVSQRARKRIEEIFGWVKTVGGGWKLRYCGVDRNRFWMEITTASYNWCGWRNWLRWRREPWDQSVPKTAENARTFRNSPIRSISHTSITSNQPEPSQSGVPSSLSRHRQPHPFQHPIR